MYTNGTYNKQRSSRTYRPRSEDVRLPDESWQVGDSDVECSVWISDGKTNFGQQYLDVSRISDDGKRLKTFRTVDVRAYFQGLAEHCARLSEQEDLSSDECDAFAFLAEGTVELLENTPSVEASKQPKRKRRNRRS